MGLSEQWREGLQWITEELNFTSAFQNQSIHSDKLIVDYFGGLLSAYAFSGETVLLNQSIDLLLLMETAGAFDPFSGMLVELKLPRSPVVNRLLLQLLLPLPPVICLLAAEREEEEDALELPAARKASTSVSPI